jgi:hypothetical protein
MMHLKTVKVTNPNNVLVQIPGYVVSQWGAQRGDTLEVTYNEGSVQIKIRPDVQRRSPAS